jgi:hypothetical protein
MKKIVFALLLFTGITFAQDMNVVKGNFDFIKNQKEINIEFDYSDFTMMKENKTETICRRKNHRVKRKIQRKR